MYTIDSLDLPVVIGTDDDDGWTKTKDATWPQLVRSANVRRQVLRDLEAETATFIEALNVLRPIMRPHSSMCVAEALLILNHQDSEARA